MALRNDDRIELRLPGDLLANLRRVSVANERSASAEVRVALRRHVERELALASPETSEGPAGNGTSTKLAGAGDGHDTD